MEVSPQAVVEYKLYERKRNQALIPYTVGLAAIVGGLIVDNDQEALKYGLLIGGGASVVVSFPFFVKSQNHYHKAIWLRNRDVLKP